MTLILPISIMERRHRVASCSSWMCGFSHVCVLFSDVRVKPAKLLVKKFLTLRYVFISTCLPSSANTHLRILAHFSVILARNYSFFVCSKKNSCYENSPFLPDNTWGQTPLGVGWGDVVCNLGFCLFVFCFVVGNQRAAPCPFALIT